MRRSLTPLAISAMPCLLAAAICWAPEPALAGSAYDVVKPHFDEAFKALEREAGNDVEDVEAEEETAPEDEEAPALPETKPAAEPAEEEPEAVKAPPAEPEAPAGLPVTLYWHVADDADVYLNGKPLRDYTPSFKNRGDEAPHPAFSTSAVLSEGDVFTVGSRRGGSWGFMLTATDASGGVAFRTDSRSWRVYDPGERADWFEPAAAVKASSAAVSVQTDPWHPQKELNAKVDAQALSIWGNPGKGTAYLLGVVSLLKPSGLIGRTLSLQSVNYPDRSIWAPGPFGELGRPAADGSKKEYVFRVAAGLADPRLVSLESVAAPGSFLIERDGRLKLEKGKGGGDPLFRTGATFRPVPGLGDESGVSFEALGVPGRFIRHDAFHLFVQAGSGDLFQKDATFKPVEAGQGKP